VNGRVKLRAEVNALCLECHATAAAFDGASAKTLFGGGVTIAAGTYGMAPAIEVTENRGHPTSNHPVLRDADKDWPAITCLTCHAAHAANRNKDLLVSQTETFEPLCLRCHK
jgi:predicted CXXCH cytochrome family protein